MDTPATFFKPATGRGADWTPRQALVHALNGVTSGEIKCNRVIIVFGDVAEDGNTEYSTINCTQNSLEYMGLLLQATQASDT